MREPYERIAGGLQDAIAAAQVKALSDAMWQILDDMGLDGLGVCPAAKAQARIAYEPFLQADFAAEPSLSADYAPEMSLQAAQAIMDEVNY